MEGRSSVQQHELPAWLKIAFTASLLTAILSVTMYATNFHFGVSTKQEVWGQLGDYVGGILNPIFSFLTLLAMLHTIRLQSMELRNSSEQLKNSAIALDKQNLILQQQNFEATLFQLLRLYNDTTRDLTVRIETKMKIGDRIKHNAHEYNGRECLAALTLRLGTIMRDPVSKLGSIGSREAYIAQRYAVFHDEYGHLIGHYFRLIYTILKIIDKQPIEDDAKRDYANILRAQLSKHELAILFYNSLSVVGKKMRPLVVKYSILKHLDPRTAIENGDFSLI